MKKIILIWIVSILLVFYGSCAADDDQSSDWSYEILDDQTVMITAYTGTGKDVRIPDFLDGYPVSTLGFDTFLFNEEITSVEIPENLIEIGDYDYLDKLQSKGTYIPVVDRPEILAPEFVKEMSDIFAKYADVVQNNPFLGCLRLNEIRVSPDNPVFAVTENMLFNKVTGGTITYPAGRQETEYKIPEGITSIGFQTFSGSKLVSIFLPESLAEISHNPFIFCTDLKEISVSPENRNFYSRDGILFSESGTLISYPFALDAETYTVPEGTKAIGDGAFYYNMFLQEIIIPEGVTTIGKRGFDQCKSLHSVFLPDGLISIEKAAFKYSDYLREINLPGTVTYIGESAFRDIYRQLVFTVEKNSYGALWVDTHNFRFQYPGEPEIKSLLTQALENLIDESGHFRLHMNYKVEKLTKGWWLKRDVYRAGNVTYIVDENEANGVEVTMYKDKMKYTLSPETKTGESWDDDYWFFEFDGAINESRNLYHRILSYAYRNDYLTIPRMMENETYLTEVFSEDSYGPETAFYFDQDGNLVYCLEETYYGVSPAGMGKGDLLFTIYDFNKDFDDSIFDISDYEITYHPKQVIDLGEISLDDIEDIAKMINNK